MVHGGPGMPDHFLTKRYPTGLEDLFTVVWWEQRVTGLSYHRDIPAKTMTVDQFVCDISALANYLRSRFGKEKIYLMGHSWGSFIGIQPAARALELFCAYIGMARMSYQAPDTGLLFHGRHDYTCCCDLAKEYFRKLEAPLKRFYTFENSAHSPVLEEADKDRSILREDVLARSTAIADAI